MTDQEAKNEILARIKSGKPELAPLPDIAVYSYQGKPLEDFVKNLLNVDGRVVCFKTKAVAVDWLLAQTKLEGATNLIYSTAQEIAGNFKEDELADLRNAHKINICITEGELGVGETGSIWVTDASLNHAACALLAQQLFIFLDKNRIVGGLPEAYEKITLQESQYGSFYTGPSATADIEAIHITGAQGPLALTALLYNCDDASVPPKVLTKSALP